MVLKRLSGGCHDDVSCPGVWVDDDVPEDVVVVGEVIDPAPVPIASGEQAVRVGRQLIRDAGLEV